MRRTASPCERCKLLSHARKMSRTEDSHHLTSRFHRLAHVVQRVAQQEVALLLNRSSDGSPAGCLGCVQECVDDTLGYHGGPLEVCQCHRRRQHQRLQLGDILHNGRQCARAVSNGTPEVPKRGQARQSGNCSANGDRLRPIHKKHAGTDRLRGGRSGRLLSAKWQAEQRLQGQQLKFQKPEEWIQERLPRIPQGTAQRREHFAHLRVHQRLPLGAQFQAHSCWRDTSHHLDSLVH
mmetsp:Transcript_27464/g.72307  ORF Transcript_27464/g.72307 Transcript_27464/m.72307 type:complete len:236 (-) Transcript_27464:237-944(-)